MSRIADVVHGTWKREGSAYRLIRTSSQQNAETRIEFNETVALVRKSIQKRANELNRMRQWSETESEALASDVKSLINTFKPNGDNRDWSRKGDELSAHTPIGRALTKVVAALDPVELASLPQRMKAVWSSNPTPMQKPFPSEIAQIADDFVKAQADWANSIDKHQIKAPTVGGGIYYVGGLGLFRDNPGGNVSVILLTVNSQGPNYGFYCELTAFDAKGMQIAKATEVLGASGDDGKAPHAASAPMDEEKIEVDADVLALIANRSTTPGRTKNLAGSLIGKITRPEEFEPLSIFLSPKLIQAANIKKLNMVADLTDDMFTTDVYKTTKETSVDEFLRKDVGSAGTAELKGGWLTVRPKRPSECRSRQANRTALGKFLRKWLTGRPLSLDDLAAFAASLPESYDNQMPTCMSGFLRRESYDEYDPNMLRFYGLLTPDQKSAMANGGLACSSLGAAELELVNRMVYQVQSQIGYVPPKGLPGQQDQAYLDLIRSELMREPTECLPTGVPPQGLITLGTTNSNVVFVSIADTDVAINGTSGYTLSAADLGRMKFYQDRPDLFPRAIRLNLNRFLFGRQVNMNFTFQFTPSVMMIQTLDDTNLDDFRTMTLDDLPDDFKKQLQESYNHYVQRYANTKPGQLNGGDSGPPL